MQFFIHCNFFCQEYKFAYLLVYFAYFTIMKYTVKRNDCFFSKFYGIVWVGFCLNTGNAFS